MMRRHFVLGACLAALLTFNAEAQTIGASGGGTASAGANPSASAGLTAVNGSATTFMRSDGAPAISQSIAPTWSGIHTFTLAPVFTDASGTRTALGLGTAAVKATGTSGNTVPLLDGTNTWANSQTFSSGAVFNGNANIAARAFLGSGAFFETGAAGQVIITATTPTIASGCGTSPSVQGNTSTAAFQLTIGTSPGTTCTLAMPTGENPQHGWHCVGDDITTTTEIVHQTAMASTSSVQLTFYNFAGTATAPTASDKILVSCMAF